MNKLHNENKCKTCKEIAELEIIKEYYKELLVEEGVNKAVANIIVGDIIYKTATAIEEEQNV